MYGAKIKAIRTARGFTQEEVAAKIHVTPATYSKMEGDKRKKWDAELVTKIAEALGVADADIMSPSAIVINLNHSSYTAAHIESQTVSMSKEVLDLLKEQLTEKDRIISELIKRIPL